eukprot:CAMPEP_0183308522 /NCGR_PEP_ID=MMETSP0160_2-20130417/22308_1 /TAXON_ID=2839 ORGANISM="Odontella Sinensis, Strain Grunow 1884" /NCGR_SAMPLE_ID=MMETSP0160_2 /ASSEMBLY_ACC=CAM_ASM_000250 /LENGTH=190 /DNA_ID=CAMNT_0025472377 /DNA_START=38 /DNA_END=610 /DNA_ORIENTATION=+
MSAQRWDEFLPGAWCVEGLLTRDECDALIEQARGAGVESMKFSGDIRHRQRVTVRLDVSELTRVLWERIRERIPQEIIIDETTENSRFLSVQECMGRWVPSGLHTGKSVVFFHGMMHDGEPLAEGSRAKWIFRTMVYYKRDQDTAPRLSPEEAKARRLLKDAEAAEESGRINEAISLYKQAYRLDPSLES